MSECETCGGTGQFIEMVCYGGPPYEVTTICTDCDGEGQTEEEEPEKPVRPNRIRDW